MALSKVEGITLFSLPLKEKSKIIKVYTLEKGLLSFVVNHISRKNSEMISFCSPCTYSEIVYLDKNKELLTTKEITIKNLYLSLRDSLKKLEAAICITKSTLASQQENKQNNVLFYMIEKYLTKIASSTNPIAYCCSFQLKLLKLEGLLNLTYKCSSCDALSQAISRGESFCTRHCYDGIAFDNHEFKKLFLLAEAKKFSEIDNIQVSKILEQKIQKLFLHVFN